MQERTNRSQVRPLVGRFWPVSVEHTRLAQLTRLGNPTDPTGHPGESRPVRTTQTSLGHNRSDWQSGKKWLYGRLSVVFGCKVVAGKLEKLEGDPILDRPRTMGWRFQMLKLTSEIDSGGRIHVGLCKGYAIFLNLKGLESFLLEWKIQGMKKTWIFCASGKGVTARLGWQGGRKMSWVPHGLEMSRESLGVDWLRVQISSFERMTYRQSAPWPFSMWGIDVIGPISPKASNRHLFILMAIDYFTKWVEVITLASVTAKAVARFLKQDIIARYEVPVTIITGNAKNLNNKIIDEICA
ncbi:hypothetical protein CRG98_030173 [Punica granatum]|uniref:Integrase catalytic domain-containing protein n=1 Tax=Punica granatum TaxID=22663 RepID=A0A2I0IZL0_PUNGR|nr:hypothetical protein CRG98_030173 [Punica granatum]